MRAGEVGDEEATAASAALSILHEIWGGDAFTARDVVKAMTIEPKIAVVNANARRRRRKGAGRSHRRRFGRTGRQTVGPADRAQHRQAVPEASCRPARMDRRRPAGRYAAQVHRPQRKHLPRRGVRPPGRSQVGECGERGECFGRRWWRRQCFSAGCGTRDAAMEGSAMSTSPAFMGNYACRGGVSASGQGAVAEKTFAPAGTEPDIIPHIPRNASPDPARSGNVGKEGNGSAGSGGSDSVFSPGCRSAGAAMERSAVSAAGISGVTSPTWGCDVGSAARSLDRKEIRSSPDRPKHSPFSPHSPEWAP